MTTSRRTSRVISPAERFQLVEEIFRDAVQIPIEERPAFVSARCAGDESVRLEVCALLEEDRRTTGALDAALLGAPPVASFAASAPRTEPVPERLGPYRVLALLGEGGMGVVYEAQQESPRRRVALKVIARELTSPLVLRRFEHEVQVLARLQHPGIAQIFEAGTHESPHGPRPYFAMELIRGDPLLDHARAGALPVRQRLDLIARIADAVHHAHQRGVIHRDLKPANILVDRAGQPRILDFGVARLIDSDVNVTSRTDLGQLIGTIAYMSPEQACGNPADLDTRTDVYSLGVIAYELLAGRLPHEVRGRTLPDVLRLISDAEPTPLGTIDRTLRGDIETVVGKAMEKDKRLRYDSASSLADDVRRLLGDQPIAARPRTVTYQLGKFARRHRSLVAALGLAVMALISAAAVSTWQAVRAERARTKAVERFDRLRELSRSLVFELHDAIAPLPGSTPARELVVAKGLEYLDGLAQDAEDDSVLLAEVAQGYARVADLQGNPRRSNLGQVPEALVSLDRAAALMRAAIDAAPTPGARAELAPRFARVLQSRAELFSYIGRIDEAIAELEQAAAAVRPLVGFAPADAALSNVLWSRGAILRRLGRPEEALAAYKESFALDEQSLAVAERPAEARRTLSTTASEIGSALLAMGNAEEAFVWFERCRAARAELLEAAPDSPRARRDLSLAYQRLGLACSELGSHADAVRNHAAAVELIRVIAAEDPRNTRAAKDLSIALQRLSEAELDGGLAADAERHALESLRTGIEAVDGSTSDLDHLNSIGLAHERLADALRAQRRLPEAESHYLLALECARRAVEADDADRLGLTMIAVVCRKLGEAALASSPLVARSASKLVAGAYFREALNALDDLARVELTPSSPFADRSELERLLSQAR